MSKRNALPKIWYKVEAPSDWWFTEEGELTKMPRGEGHSALFSSYKIPHRRLLDCIKWVQAKAKEIGEDISIISFFYRGKTPKHRERWSREYIIFHKDR